MRFFHHLFNTMLNRYSIGKEGLGNKKNNYWKVERNRKQKKIFFVHFWIGFFFFVTHTFFLLLLFFLSFLKSTIKMIEYELISRFYFSVLFYFYFYFYFILFFFDSNKETKKNNSQTNQQNVFKISRPFPDSS